VVGRLAFVRSQTHRHWHLLGFERYELRGLDGRLLGRDRKTGFCLGDRYARELTLPRMPRSPVWSAECGRGEPQLRRLVEGLSVGYGDDYPPSREGQWIDVSGLPPGRYQLVHVADPGRRLLESTRTDDAASLLLRLTPRGVEVLARCPGRPRCAGTPNERGR
jgi:hypothetical protein